MGSVTVNVLKTLFITLGGLMIAALIYTLYIDGLPFRMELLTPWMAATLIDFYILTAALAAWVAYKEQSFISAVAWIIMLICFGSITTCAYILMQLFKLSSQESFQDPFYYVLVKQNSKVGAERKRRFSSVVIARILFSILGCFMLGSLIYTIVTDGTPFRKELLTPWLKVTLVDFYINVVTISVWAIHKESKWISALIWIVLFICLGSITICAYIVVQLFQLSSEDPLYVVLLNSRNRRKGDEPIDNPTSYGHLYE